MNKRIEVNETHYVYVEATVLFGGFPSLNVKKGEKYSFKVNPLCKWRRNKIDFNANGSLISFVSRKKLRFPEAPYHSLCASINKSEFSQFNIGTWLNAKEIDEDGEMHFYANKSLGNSSQGKGYVIVEVTRVD